MSFACRTGSTGGGAGTPGDRKLSPRVSARLLRGDADDADAGDWKLLLRTSGDRIAAGASPPLAAAPLVLPRVPGPGDPFPGAAAAAAAAVAAVAAAAPTVAAVPDPVGRDAMSAISGGGGEWRPAQVVPAARLSPPLVRPVASAAVAWRGRLVAPPTG